MACGRRIDAQRGPIEVPLCFIWGSAGKEGGQAGWSSAETGWRPAWIKGDSRRRRPWPAFVAPVRDSDLAFFVLQMTGSNEFKLNQPPEDGISSVKFSPNTSQFLLVSSWDTSVRLYDVPANSMRLKYQHNGAVLDCAFYDRSNACLERWIRSSTENA